jgi:predicted amidohydrolase YtcJ
VKTFEQTASIRGTKPELLNGSKGWVCLVAALLLWGSLFSEAAPSLIVHHGRIVSVDKDFSIHEAMAIEGERIVKVGSNRQVLELKAPESQLLDLKGAMVLPGLIDSHVHPLSAAMLEFDHAIPDMETIQDVLEYFATRARIIPEGEWLQLQQVFITRLREQRYPTRVELDRVAPRHPVIFRTGPDASMNSLGLKLCGIERDFKIPEGVPGRVEKDEHGEPTGILRTYANYVKVDFPSGKKPTETDYRERLVRLFKDYNSVGLTAAADRAADISSLEHYQTLKRDGRLTVRLVASPRIETLGPLESIKERVRAVAKHPLFLHGDSMLKIIGIKTFLDGGMLTGSAYMREPWGVSKIYSITDPNYRGTLFIPSERLLPIVRTAMESGLQFTAHSVGDGAVQTLLDVYEELSKEMPIARTRPCITHCNFMSQEAVEKLPKLGVVADLQPAWLYLDTRTLVDQFGYDRMRYFQPLSSLFKNGAVVGGGSDHMQKIGSLRSINPYNPFLAMWTAITRQARWYGGKLHPEEALTREQAIRFYTANNAYLIFRENEIGSLEAGKFADFIILDRDLLHCPVDDVKTAAVRKTFLAGKEVYSR